MFSPAQLRMFFRVLLNIDSYTFDDVAEQLAAKDDSNQQTSVKRQVDQAFGSLMRLLIEPNIPAGPFDDQLRYG
jgi:hypothetical protein